MKKVALIAGSLIAFGSFATAGGDLAKPMEPEVTIPAVMDEDTTSGFYAGLGATYNRTYSQADSAWFDNNTAGQDATLGLTGILGYTFTENFGAEGRATKTVSGADYAKMSAYSIFAKPMYEVIDATNIYGLLGYGSVTVDGEVSGTELLSANGFQWGLGVAYGLTQELSLFVDYTQLMSKEGVTAFNVGTAPVTTVNELSVDGLTFGVNYSF